GAFPRLTAVEPSAAPAVTVQATEVSGGRPLTLAYHSPGVLPGDMAVCWVPEGPVTSRVAAVASPWTRAVTASVQTGGLSSGVTSCAWAERASGAVDGSRPSASGCSASGVSAGPEGVGLGAAVPVPPGEGASAGGVPVPAVPCGAEPLGRG